MAIYVAIAYFDYDGSDIIGVYDSYSAAQEACDNHKYMDGSLRGDGRCVEEFELNSTEAVDI